jgi:3-hydroxyisobutyrate dehydrogenase-like beta-hydroxyacid dehydrogenase
LIVAFLGLGHMGQPIARNLVLAGFEVRTWNRSGGAVEGAHGCRTIEEAVRPAEVVITMLSEDAALRAVAFGEGKLIASLRTGGIHVGMSTISVALATELATVHAEGGQRFVNAPVFGRPDMAAAGKLFLVPGGSSADITELAPLFGAVGQGTFPMPGAAESAVAKLCGNFMLASLIESLGEALTLGEKGGIRPEQLLGMLTGTLFGIPVVHGYGGMMVRQQFTPAGFAMALGLKDMKLVLEAGGGLEVPLPLADLLRTRFLQAMAQGKGDLDWSGMTTVIRESAGLE